MNLLTGTNFRAIKSIKKCAQLKTTNYSVFYFIKLQALKIHALLQESAKSTLYTCDILEEKF